MLKNHWYLVCPASELKNEIFPFTVLGEHIILFRTRSGEITALEDRCCHRNVKLSLGYLEDSRIICGYHGWTYNTEGKCIHIPSQQDEKRIPQTAQLKKYPLLEFNRWIWVFMGDEKKAGSVEPHNIPEMDSWDFTYKSYTFKADLESTAESLIDPYHIAYTHTRSIGQFMGQIREYPAHFNMKILDDGLEGSYLRENTGSFFEKTYFGNQKQHLTKYRFYYPTISRLEIEFKERTLLILEHVMQVDDEHVNMKQITLWKNIFSKFPSFARYFMGRKSEKIVKEDIVLLKSQYDILRSGKYSVDEVSVKGDEISVAFRKYWRKRMAEKE